MELSYTWGALTEAQNTSQPAPSPATARPRNSIARKPALASAKCAKAMSNHPMMVGMPPIIRASFRPKRSLNGHANGAPNMAPTLSSPCACRRKEDYQGNKRASGSGVHLQNRPIIMTSFLKKDQVLTPNKLATSEFCFIP